MRDRLFLKSVDHLNSLLIFVVAVFMIEAVYARSIYLGQFWLAMLVAIPVKIYVYSGIYGLLVEVISGQEMVISFSRFHHNAIRYLPLYTLISIGLYVVSLALFALFPFYRSMTSLKYFYPLVGILIAYVLSHRIISDKYLKIMNLGPRIVRISWNEALALLCLFGLECALSWSQAILPSTGMDWSRPITLLVKYISLLQFIYISFLILNAYRDVLEKKDQSKEIYLINPCGGGVYNSIAYLSQRENPPVFVVLKALSPKDYTFRVFNRIFWRNRYYHGDKLVAITCYTSNCAEAYKIAKEFKKRGSKVVMGGPHVTYLPDEALEFCDSVVIGEAEAVWAQVMSDYEKNSLKPKYSGISTDAQHAEVHKELMRSPPQITKDFMETTRGCKFRCHFCTVPSLSGGKTRKKPIGEIVELIQKIKPICKEFSFIDNNIYSDPAYAKELFSALIPLKIKWRTQCTIDIAKNTETLALARESGCVGILFGFEISGGSLEKQRGGKFAMVDNYIRYSKIVKKMGIKIKGHFIFGFDSDTLGSLVRLWLFCFRIFPQWTAVSILTPYPGSVLYDDMLSQNRILNLNWRNFGTTHLVIKHPTMNNRFVSLLFPLIYIFYYLTTSVEGIKLLLIVSGITIYDLLNN